MLGCVFLSLPKHATKAGCSPASPERKAPPEESSEPPSARRTAQQALKTANRGSKASYQPQGGERRIGRTRRRAAASTGTRETPEPEGGQAEGAAAASSPQVRLLVDFDYMADSTTKNMEHYFPDYW